MQLYEYTVIPAPSRGEKVRGARTGVERFSYSLAMEMNRMAASGWEYVRAETLPCEERSGLTSRTTVYHNVLVFRRALAQPGNQPSYQAAPAHHAVPQAVAQPAPQQQAAEAYAAAASEPPLPVDPSWPDGPESAAETYAAHVDNYDDPGTLDADDSDAAAPPAFTRRPPLSAARETDSPSSAASRLGPAER